jgi:hypothetical protein
MTRIFSAFLLLICVNILVSDILFSQQKGLLTGIVVDKNTQSLLKDINVKLLGTNFTTKTLGDGSFRFADIPVGTYEVEVTSASYQRHIENNVVISTGIDRELV